jgi:hypothetical protein
MARRIVIPGLVSCGLVAAAVFAVVVLTAPARSSAMPGGLHAVDVRLTPAPTGGRSGAARQPPSTAASRRPAVRLNLRRTLPPRSALPSDITCAATVRKSPWEPRPANRAANSRTPPAGWRQHPFQGFEPAAQARVVPRVDGRFTGTTDEILQWAACKWGFDADTVRAQAVSESDWQMSENGDGGSSWGILQVKPSAHPGTWPWARASTAYNVDYTLARRRACYEGWSYEGPRTRGDLWGCIGMWYSGTYGSGYGRYVADVRHWYRTKPWRSW